MADFSNILKIDKNAGYGDHNTISAGIAAAQAAGASTTNPYILDINFGIYTENPEVTAGIHLRGKGMYQVRIDGQLKMHGGTSIAALRVFPSSAYGMTWAIQFINDTPGASAFIYGCNIVLSNTVGSTTSCIEASGDRADAILYITGCYFYANHRYTTTPNTDKAIRNVHYRLKSDFQSAIETWATRHKASVGSNGTSASTFILCEAVAPASGLAYVHVESSSYEDIYSGNGIAPETTVLQSVNTMHPGAWLDISMLLPFKDNVRDFFPAYDIAYAGTQWNIFFNRETRRLRVRSALRLRDSGVDFDYYPSLGLDHVPTGLDVAPEGSEVHHI